MNITWKGAKAFESGRRNNKINRIIIHWIAAGDLESASNWFNREKADTSAHYGIEDDKVYQWVKEEDTAYHAGEFNTNLVSIGIEHSATPKRPASDATYKTSAELVATICKKYNIPLDRTHILKHNQVVPTQCCGTVDVDRIIKEAGKFITNPCEEENARLKVESFDLKKVIKELKDEYDILKNKSDVVDTANNTKIIELGNEIRSYKLEMGTLIESVKDLTDKLAISEAKNVNTIGKYSGWELINIGIDKIIKAIKGGGKK